jgi:hypothetical protein
MVSDFPNGFWLPQRFLIALRNHWDNKKPLGKSETIEEIRKHWGNQKPVTLKLLRKLKYNVILTMQIFTQISYI